MGMNHFYKLLPALCLFFTFNLPSYCQTGTNNFPATGNASVGTTAAPNTFTVNGSSITNGTISQSGGALSATSGFSSYLNTNSTTTASTANLNPGLAVYGGQWYWYGMDLGWNASSGRWRTRIFTPYSADVALSYINETGSAPTSQSNLSDGLVMMGGSGNILIGKSSQTNSAYKLDVAGSVRANAVTVNTTGADFVFDPAYSLPALSEVAAYIKANHHLPQLTSAAAMQKDGLNLGDNQIKLLQKVEELTLYAIEADRQIQLLKTANSRQVKFLEEQQKMIDDQQQLLEKLEAAPREAPATPAPYIPAPRPSAGSR
jgi:hypothetical protein